MKAQKLPVQVECRWLTAVSVDAVAEWCAGVPTAELLYSRAQGGYLIRGAAGDSDPLLIRCEPRAGVVIGTLEGAHLAEFGDIVIQGVQGEFYPCKAEIFWRTYELICSHDPTCADLRDCAGI